MHIPETLPTWAVAIVVGAMALTIRVLWAKLGKLEEAREEDQREIRTLLGEENADDTQH